MLYNLERRYQGTPGNLMGELFQEKLGCLAQIGDGFLDTLSL